MKHEWELYFIYLGQCYSTWWSASHHLPICRECIGKPQWLLLGTLYGGGQGGGISFCSICVSIFLSLSSSGALPQQAWGGESQNSVRVAWKWLGNRGATDLLRFPFGPSTRSPTMQSYSAASSPPRRCPGPQHCTPVNQRQRQHCPLGCPLLPQPPLLDGGLSTVD